MTEKLKPMNLRLALRHEGKFWNAYIAKSDTMLDAIHIGSIAMRFVEANKERKQAFMALMQACMTDTCKDVMGVDAEWPDGPQPAPESERAGHS